MALEEEELIRQKESNATALAAIGSRKRPKNEALGDFGNLTSTISHKHQNHRINLKDVIFLCENDFWLRKSSILYKLHLSPTK